MVTAARRLCDAPKFRQDAPLPCRPDAGHAGAGSAGGRSSAISRKISANSVQKCRRRHGELQKRALVLEENDFAAALLAEPDRTITDGGDRCGLQRIQHFATVFRRVTGVSPREFRRSLQ